LTRFWSDIVPRKEFLKNVRRIVVKVGSSTITEGGTISAGRIAGIASDIAALLKQRYEVVLVSSGAISAGAGALGKKREFLSIPEKQALAAVGQTILMNEYRKCFLREGRDVGQILLTEDDVKHRSRFLNARHTFNSLLGMSVVPVVNENDSVAIKEIKFGDNDTLSAHVANIVEADLLIILSDVNGFYRDLSDHRPLELVREITEDMRRRAGGAGSVHGTGGMITKIKAADMMIKSGERMIIANGNEERILSRIMKGENTGTLFMGAERSLPSRKRWIAFNMKSGGSITVDDGAAKALIEKKKSLLASGILEVSGKFELGAAVEVYDTAGALIGKGIVNYTHRELQLIKGKKSREIEGILGGTYFDEVINRDDLITY
jgi:glutamate 5-kinase